MFIFFSIYLLKFPGIKNSFFHFVALIIFLVDNNSVPFVSLKITNRSSCSEVFCKKSVLSNFAKFTGKQRCQSFFFNKVGGLISATLSIMILWHRCFLVNFVKFLRKPFLKEHHWWLLLNLMFLFT